jgi:hypothetical protein
MSSHLWLAGECNMGEIGRWHFIGVFDSRERAEAATGEWDKQQYSGPAAVLSRKYCVMPITPNVTTAKDVADMVAKAAEMELRQAG